jgi:hypothetical protein
VGERWLRKTGFVPDSGYVNGVGNLEAAAEAVAVIG